MREIKFRYTYKCKEDGAIYQEITLIQCLEGRGDRPFALDTNNPYWDIIARDEYTGLKDRGDEEAYHKDIFNAGFEDNWIMKWDEMNAGFRLVSILGYDSLPARKVKEMVHIGNIYENPELVAPTNKEKEYGNTKTFDNPKECFDFAYNLYRQGIKPYCHLCAGDYYVEYEEQV